MATTQQKRDWWADWRHAAATDAQIPVYPTAILTPSAGEHTYTMALRVSAGTVDSRADALNAGEGYIMVEDLGPA